MPDQLDLSRTRQLTTEIVSAYVRNHNLGTADLPVLITSVHNSLHGLMNPAVAEPAALIPAVPWKRSITAENVICMECGWKGKTLKRHLSSQHNLTADDYRKRWNLPSDFPMTATNYSKQRSQLAKDLGLGRRPGTATATAALNQQPEPESEADKQPEGETSSTQQETAAAAPASETSTPEPAAQQPTAQPAAQKRNPTRKAGTAKKTGGKRTAAKPAKAKAKATSKRSAAKTAPRRRAAKKETAAPAAST